MIFKKNILSVLSLFMQFYGLYGQQINCKIHLNLSNTDEKPSIYINRESIFYYSSKTEGLKDTIFFSIEEPIGVTLFINNDGERVFQFYLEEGNYTLNIDCKNRTAAVVGSPLNDEFKEMMRVHDSLFKEYNIMHAMLYPYNGMDRDSAHAWLQKYLPICNELSDKHSEQFYETHLSSFLTLEHIYSTLVYTFDDPGYDTIEYDVKKLKILFDKLDIKLRKYKMYDECVVMFSKERVKPPEITKPLWEYENKN